MSSNIPRDFLETVEMQMIWRVLERAGYYGTKSQVDADISRDAAKFLLKLFQNGIDAEDDLVAALDARGRSSVDGGETPRQVRLEAVDRWADEGGSVFES